MAVRLRAAKACEEYPIDHGRQRQRWLITGVVAAVTAVAVATVLAAGLGRHGGSSAAVLGRTAPGWSGPTVNGLGVADGSIARHWTVLNFFATWCTPCQQETPQLAEFNAAHRSSGDARVVGVLYLDSADSARRFVSSHGVTWPIVDDPHGDIASRYEVTGLPQSFVIRPDGRLAARVFGAVTQSKLDALIGSAT